MRTAELIPAYVWDCDHCGRENFQRAVSRLLNGDNPAEAVLIRAIEGMPPDAPVPPGWKYRFMTEPERVACRACKTIFRSETMGGSGYRELTVPDGG